MSDVKCKYFEGTVNPADAKMDKPVDCKCGDDVVAINPTYCCSKHYVNCPWFKRKEGAGTIEAPAVASEQTTELTQHDVAIELHAEIMQYKAVAASALYEMCVRLKKMRDDKLYAELGYTSFGAYCEQKAGIKERQGYNYIKALENLGKDVLQSNANIGITKLELLTHVPELDRAGFIEGTDLDTITVEDLKKKIADLEKENGLKAEQLSLFEEQVDKLKTASESTEDLKKEIEKLKSNLETAEAKASEYKTAAESAEKRAKEAESRPIEVAVAEIPEGEVEKIRNEAVTAATKAAETEKKEALAKLRTEMSNGYTEMTDELKKAHAAETEKMTAEISELKKQLAEAEKLNAATKPTAISEGDATIRVKLHFNIIQEQVDGLLEALEDIEDIERKNKYKKNLRAFAENIIAAVEE